MIGTASAHVASQAWCGTVSDGDGSKALLPLNGSYGTGLHASPSRLVGPQRGAQAEQERVI